MNKIFVTGIGPGSDLHITQAALEAINKSDVVVGYKTYVNLINHLIDKDKEIVVTGMTGEIERCKIAIQKALQGKTVSVISSGDPGIYGMAGLLLELTHTNSDYKSLDIEVVPGITAASAAAAILGAPLMNDFAVISLSDLLTPQEIIIHRVKKIAESGITCAVYNPASKKRRQLIAEIVKIFSDTRNAHIPCGYVKNAYRKNQTHWIGTIDKLPISDIDMFTILIIGGAGTVIQNNKLITQRGYKYTGYIQ